MWSFIKKLFHHKDQPVAKQMVAEDQKHHQRQRKRRHFFKNSRLRQQRKTRSRSTRITVKVYDAFLQFLNFKK